MDNIECNRGLLVAWLRGLDGSDDYRVLAQAAAKMLEADAHEIIEAHGVARAQGRLALEARADEREHIRAALLALPRFTCLEESDDAVQERPDGEWINRDDVLEVCGPQPTTQHGGKD